MASDRYTIVDCPGVPSGGVQLWRQQHPQVWPPARPVRVLPTLAVDIVVNLGDTFELVTGAAAAEMSRFHVVGPRSRPILVAATGVTDLCILRLPPWTAGALLRVNPDEIRDQVLDLADVLGDRRARRLRSDLVNGWPHSLAKNPIAVAPGDAVRAALLQIKRAAGKLGIQRLSHQVGVSRRHLTRLFRHACGHGPKTVSSIVQCQAALYRLRFGHRPADVAAAAGYVDQAHMTRSLQRLAGVSPAQVVRLSETPLHRHFNAAAAPTSQMCKTVYL